jgi:hypothetical protein
LIDPAAPAWARTSPELIAENLKTPPRKEQPSKPSKLSLEEDDALLAALKGDQTLGSGSTDRRGAAATGMALLDGAEPTQPLLRSPIRAYHGSPHDFDRFDVSKIGDKKSN